MKDIVLRRGLVNCVNSQNQKKKKLGIVPGF